MYENGFARPRCIHGLYYPSLDPTAGAVCAFLERAETQIIAVFSPSLLDALAFRARSSGKLSALCHRPANVTASGPGGVIQKKSRKISNGQRGLPRRPGSSPAVEDGACQGARSDERSSLALDWRWPLPQRTERIVSVNSVSGSVPPCPCALSGAGP